MVITANEKRTASKSSRARMCSLCPPPPITPEQRHPAKLDRLIVPDRVRKERGEASVAQDNWHDNCARDCRDALAEDARVVTSDVSGAAGAASAGGARLCPASTSLMPP